MRGLLSCLWPFEPSWATTTLDSRHIQGRCDRKRPPTGDQSGRRWWGHDKNGWQLLEAIDASRERLEGKIDLLSVDLGLILEDSWKFSERVATLEGIAQTLTPAVQSADHCILALEVHTWHLAARLDDQEGQAHRNNVCIEHADGDSLLAYPGDFVPGDVGPREPLQILCLRAGADTSPWYPTAFGGGPSSAFPGQGSSPATGPCAQSICGRQRQDVSVPWLHPPHSDAKGIIPGSEGEAMRLGAAQLCVLPCST
ncbi:hypothetical protein NDU88_007620 [Pleurodeles waltl]|uniref:Uncharacterized protein n=1 Tax=Pleurodeles waltl TaxID=8319 RepID=A0AAV7RTK1_PLEWA|nr:hypothetical protein NDU88_007620 [Pleurodeles waltl]